MSMNTVAQLPFDECKHYIRVVLSQTANVLDCLSFSEQLKAHSLVKETAIYFSPNVEGLFTFPVEHYVKVFLKKSASIKKGLALSQALKANTLVQATCLRLNPKFGHLLSMQSRVQKCRQQADELLALLRRQRKEKE